MGHLEGVFGRAAEQAAVSEALRAVGRCTVVGTGGLGKSTLARTVADRFSAPVVWVDVEPLESFDALLRTLLGALGIAVLPGDQPAHLVAAAIADAASLIVIDGAERFASQFAELADRWKTAPDGPWLLVTSRVPLAPLIGSMHRLSPLSTSAERLEESDAGAMMRALVAAHGGDAAALIAAPADFASLLGSTGGLPLAIELVAARVARFGLEFVAGRSPAFGDVVERCLERTLQLLDPGDVALFRKLGVTGGPVSMRLITAIGGEPDELVVDRVGRLVDHGLVQPIAGRFDMLPPIRDVARRQLHEAGESDVVLTSAARWAYDLAGGTDRRDDPSSARAASEHLDEFVHLAWAAAVAGHRALALDLAAVLFGALHDRLRNHDSLALLEAALGTEGEVDLDPDHEARSAVRAAICASECDTAARAERWLDRADRAAARSPDSGAVSSHIASIRAFVALDEGRLDAAWQHSERSIQLARQARQWFIVHQSIVCMAMCALGHGDLDQATIFADEVIRWGRQHDLYSELNARVVLGWCQLERGRRREAAEQAALVCHEVEALGGYAREVGLESELLLLAAVPPDDDRIGLDRYDATSSWSVRLEQRLRRAAGAPLRRRPDSVIQTAVDVALLAGLVPHARIRVEASLLLGDAALVAGDLGQARLAYVQALRDAIRGPYRLRCADALDGLAAVAEATRIVSAAAPARSLAAAIRARCGAAAWRGIDDAVMRGPTGRGTGAGGRHPAHWWHDGTPTKECADELNAMLRTAPTSPGTASDVLTRAERQIVELVATGLTNHDIAERLFISRRTVETHLTHIFRKLDLRTRTQLAAVHLRAASVSGTDGDD